MIRQVIKGARSFSLSPLKFSLFNTFQFKYSSYRFHSNIAKRSNVGIVASVSPLRQRIAKYISFSTFRSSMRTPRQAYEDTTKQFREANIFEPEQSAKYLLSCALGIGYRHSSFLNVIDQKNIALSGEQEVLLSRFIDQRLNHTPIQYIIGNWDFYGLTLSCKAPVLIPRPETEDLVDKIIQSNILNKKNLNLRILDIGVGTGAIGLALLSKYPKLECVGIDINPEAVSLAMENAIDLGLDDRYTCYLSSFNDFALQSIHRHSFDLIVSNPPYIPSNEIDNLQTEVKGFEDRVALDGGHDGLDVVRDILSLGPSLLSENGTKEIWLEVARQHPTMIEEYVNSVDFTKTGKRMHAESLVDFSELSRFSRIRIT